MECHNHPGVQAVGTCAGCAESFCDSCLVAIKGQHYCGSCKTMAVDAMPVVEECAEAKDALKYAIIGIFCFFFILEPIAIAKALKARSMIAADPTLGGSGKATAALIIAIIVLLLGSLGLIARFAGGSG